MKLAAFKLDVTPPVGAWMAYDRNEKVDTPIYIRGIMIDDGTSRAVILSCDFLCIWGQTWLDWRKAVADASGTREDRVFLHSVHQHDSLRIVPQWNEFNTENDKEYVSRTYCYRTIDELCRMIADLSADDNSWTIVNKVMTAEKRIKGLASNRRMIDAGGKCFAMRWSMCGDKVLRELPVGLIDPLLRTIAFKAGDGRIIAALHFYASHPMTAYRRAMVSQDVPGVALEYVAQNSDPATHNMYLTGCGGNVTFGKYFTDNIEESLEIMGGILGRGMLENLEQLTEHPAGKLEFDDAIFDFPLDPEITEEKILLKMREADGNSSKADLALRMIIARNWEKWRKCHISRMSIGDSVHFLSLPAEMCVEYQLYAQSLIPEQFLACAAYGNGTYHYIPTARMYEEGGYEPEYGSISTADVEMPLKGAIAQVLSPLQ